MPATSGYQPIPLREFGGLNTLQNATDLPFFMSPDCSDVEFFPGRVQTRPGTQSVIVTGTAGNITYNKSFLLPNGNAQTLFTDSLGNVFYEDVTNNPGVSNLIFQGSFTGNYFLPNSVTLFGAEFIAQGNGVQGRDIPRRWDGSNFTRISSCGPGAPPSVADFIPPVATVGTTGGGTTVAIVGSPTGQQAVGPLIGNPYPPPKFLSTNVLVTTTTPHGFSVGQTVTLAGMAGVPGTGGPVEGSFVIASVPSSTTFTFAYTLYNGGALPVNIGGGGFATVGPPATTTIARLNNTTTAQTSAVHNFQVGWQVQVSGIPTVAVGGAAAATNNNGVITVTTTTPHGMVPGATAIISGMSDATYNGTYTVLSDPSPTTFIVSGSTTTTSATGGAVSSTLNGIFTISAIPSPTSFSYTDFGPMISSTSSGTAQILGSVVGGQHQLSVSFEYASGYITRPSPPVTFNAGGGNMLSVSNIPIGPPNVVKRILIMTPLQSGNFYADEASTMVINDNSTTSAIINPSDEALLNSTDFTYLFNLLVLPPCAGVAAYKSRLFAWGCNNDIQNFLNLGFDGGFSGVPGLTAPLGWTPDPTNFNAAGNYAGGIAGGAYAITGDGVHTTLGMISQTAVRDYLGNPILSSGINYEIIARVRKNNILASATLYIQLVSVSTGFSSGIVLPGSSVTTNSWGYETALCGAISTPIPTDLVLQIYATGLAAGESFFVDEIELIPFNNPVQISTVLASYVEDPESFDGLTGFLQPAEGQGQAIRNCFVIRDYFYITKQRSLFVTSDNGNEPADGAAGAWQIDIVSDKVGTESSRGVGIGDEWALIACESGLWYFTGGQIGDDNNFALEILPTWNNINWAFAPLIDVKVDTNRKRVYCNVPTGTSVLDNQILTLDYVQGWGNPEFSGNTVTSMSGGYGRKWCPWTIQAASVARVIRQDGTLQMFFGNNGSNGNIYQLMEGVLGDYATPNPVSAINSYWQSGYAQETYRLNFGYLLANVVGIGTLALTLFKGGPQWSRSIRGWTLNTLGVFNMERQIQLQSSRMAVRFGTDAVGSYFSNQGMFLMVEPAVYAPTRMINA